MPSQTNLFANEVPQMPEGYYSGDKLNPNLKAFVEAHLDENPYDPETDDYDVPAFDKPINTTKATAIYNMHTYWSKKPHDAIRQYIQHYTKPRDLVLDPFCGSGGTALAALMDGRKAIAIDRSPAATFITKNYCTPVNLNDLENAFEHIKGKVKSEIDWLYETKCEKCGGKATTGYTVYSQVFECPRCLQKTPLFGCIGIRKIQEPGKKEKNVTVCPYCYEKNIEEEISPRNKKLGSVPVLVSYTCLGSCKPKKDQRRFDDSDPKKKEYFEKYDLGKIKEIENAECPHWYPDHDFPKSFHLYGRCALHLQKIEKISDFFTKRSLWALAAFREALSDVANPNSEKAAAALWITITTVALTGTKMLRETKRAIQAGTYYFPAISREIRISNGIDYNFLQLKKAENELSELIAENPEVIISTQNANDLSNIASSSVDYIFTDPPYTDKIFFGELNILWEAWLGADLTWLQEEIVVKPKSDFTYEIWVEKMRSVFRECYRVLKPGRYVSLCFHGKTEEWQAIQDLMAEAGFLVAKQGNTLFIDAEQKSYRQLTAEDNTLRDLVINFRKPNLNESASSIILSGKEDERTLNDKVCTIIRDFLAVNPGTTKDRIYDQLVSRMVRSGQMEAHNFDELLRQVAEPQGTSVDSTHEIRRWYLKETEITVIDEAESDKEEGAAKKVGDFIAKWLEQNPAEEGVHYSDLFEHYIYAVPLQDKPRRRLQDWLLDYFYKTPSGTYRLPITEEEAEAKARARAAGTNRRIKRFLSYLEQGLAVPEREMPNDATLAEWIRHCKRSGLYENGKYLYEHGGLNLDNLSEELMVEVEEDYQVCVRMILRNESAAASKSTKRKKKG